MEQISKMLNQAFQATAPLAHSTTLRNEIRTCACGKPFTAYIKVLDGKDTLDGETTCPACRYKLREETQRQERLAMLPEAREAQRDVWYESYNLPAAFQAKTFDNFDEKLQPNAYIIVKNYDYGWDDTIDPPTPPPSLVLLSPNLYGVGKTHLVAALMNQIVRTSDAISVYKDGRFRRLPCPVYFVAENILIGRIRQTFSRSNQHNDDEFYEETEEDIYKKLERVDLLIIDDVGKVRPRDYSFLQGVYFRIIDARYTAQKPIILTTNLSLTELENHIGGACADRLVEMAGKEGFIIMKGTSYRKRKA